MATVFKTLMVVLGFLFLYIPHSALAVGPYNDIRNEINYCKSQGGSIVKIKSGSVIKIDEDTIDTTGCPDCFCQFNDASLCTMKHLLKVCDKGQYTSYHVIDELFSDFVIGNGTYGYVASPPTGKHFQVIKNNSELGSKIRYASHNDMIKFFGTDWSDDSRWSDDSNYLFVEVGICNSSNKAVTHDFSLYYNGKKIKTYSPSTGLIGPNAYDNCIDETMYVFLDLNTESGEHTFSVVSDEEELSKKNNVYSFYVDKKEFRYISHTDDSDRKHNFYKTITGDIVDADQLEIDFYNSKKEEREAQEKESVWYKLHSRIFLFIKHVFASFKQ